MVLTTLCIAVLTSSCMKTRSQVKDDVKDETAIDHDSEQTKMPTYKGSRSEVEEIKNEVTRISGKLEEIEHANKQQGTSSYSDLKQELVRLDSRIGELEKNHILILTELKALKDHESLQSQASKTPTPALLDDAQRLLEDKKFEEAEEKFKVIMGKVQKGKDAAEAAFGLGEAQYAQKKYKDAILAYSKVQELSAKSARNPESLYKIGLCFQQLNMQSEANNFFKVLLERFPKSAEAKKAKGRIK